MITNGAAVEHHSERRRWAPAQSSVSGWPCSCWAEEWACLGVSRSSWQRVGVGVMGSLRFVLRMAAGHGESGVSPHPHAWKMQKTGVLKWVWEKQASVWAGHTRHGLDAAQWEHWAGSGCLHPERRDVPNWTKVGLLD